MQSKAVLRGFGVLLLLWCACTPKREAPPKPAPQPVAAVGVRAPEITRPTLPNGPSITIPGDDKRVTAIVFFATWSSPDLMLVSVMGQLAKLYGDALRVVGVGLDDDDKELVPATKARGVEFPIVWDRNHEIARLYPIQTTPTLYLLDKDGVVRFVHAAYREHDEELIDRELVHLLGNPAIACTGPGSREDMYLCVLRCERGAKQGRCNARDCREACLRENVPRNAALATCSKPRPKTPEACEAFCASEAFNQAYGVCRHQSAVDQALQTECENRCGVGPCRESCRR